MQSKPAVKISSSPSSTVFAPWPSTKQLVYSSSGQVGYDEVDWDRHDGRTETLEQEQLLSKWPIRRVPSVNSEETFSQMQADATPPAHRKRFLRYISASTDTTSTAVSPVHQTSVAKVSITDRKGRGTVAKSSMEGAEGIQPPENLPVDSNHQRRPCHRSHLVRQEATGAASTVDRHCGIRPVYSVGPSAFNTDGDPFVLKGQYGSYAVGEIAGTGSFGAVFEAVCVETSTKVAIKRVLLDPRFKNRELQIMASLDHPNIVCLRDYCISDDNPLENCTPSAKAHRIRGSQVLHLIMDYVPSSLHSVLRSHTRAGKFLPMSVIRLFMFQLLQAAGYLHSQGLAHRDIKLPNILIDMESGMLRLCDFGCAKVLEPGGASVAYICTRFYRAPELIMGQSCYTCSIDLWAIGCVLGELLSGSALFRGESSIDQLTKIVEVLGTPSLEDCEANRCCRAIAQAVGQRLDPLPWDRVIPDFGNRVPTAAADLLEQLLQYVPDRRIDAYEACSHRFFDPLFYRSSRDFREYLHALNTSFQCQTSHTMSVLSQSNGGLHSSKAFQGCSPSEWNAKSQGRCTIPPAGKRGGSAMGNRVSSRPVLRTLSVCETSTQELSDSQHAQDTASIDSGIAGSYWVSLSPMTPRSLELDSNFSIPRTRQGTQCTLEEMLRGRAHPQGASTDLGFRHAINSQPPLTYRERSTGNHGIGVSQNHMDNVGLHVKIDSLHDADGC